VLFGRNFVYEQGVQIARVYRVKHSLWTVFKLWI